MIQDLKASDKLGENLQSVNILNTKDSLNTK